MFLITDRDRQHLLLQAQTAMGEPAADTLMASLYPADPTELVTKEHLGLRLDALKSDLRASLWRMAFMLLVGQAVLPAVAERLLEKL